MAGTAHNGQMCEYGYLILTLIREIVCGLSEISLGVMQQAIIVLLIQYSIACYVYMYVCIVMQVTNYTAI